MALNQQQFREEFRSDIPASYNGVRHGVIALSIGLVAIVVCLSLLSAPLRWFEWAIVPLVVVAWNFGEWWMHLHILHKPHKNKVLRALYKRHTMAHHQFFTHDSAIIESTNDLSIVFFPVYALPAILLMSSPVAIVLWVVLSANAALVFMATVAFMYILFEVMHLCSHVPDNAFVRNFPVINTMRRHHIAHHNQRLMMDKNMTFTLPVADWLMGTCDVKRGLIGTIFNGYSEKYLIDEARPAKKDG